MIDSSMIGSRELPIWRRATYTSIDDDYRMWRFSSAKSLCEALLKEPSTRKERYGFSAKEWENIETVAGGDLWPVPETVYTRQDWIRDRELNAVAGQEIEESIYNEMFEVLPPLNLPRCERTEGYTAGFMVSEADSIDPLGRGTLYNAYGKKDGRYYYIGLLPQKHFS